MYEPQLLGAGQEQGGRIRLSSFSGIRPNVGSARRFSTTTEKSLVADLRTILGPQYVDRAREIATRMTEPAKSVAAAADLVEDFARLERVG